MSNAQDTRNGTWYLARHAAAILFVLVAGMGYAVSPLVEGPVAVEDSTITEPEFLPSECALDGLVFADCNLEF